MRAKRMEAGLYLRKRTYLIFPYSRTTTGLLMGSEPVTRLGADAGDSELGTAIRSALALFEEGVRHPSGDEFDAMPDPILVAAGVKTLRKFADGTLACAVREENGAIVFVPSEPGPNRGQPHGSFFYLPQHAVEVPASAAAEEVGSAAREALARCL